ncbi:tetratricopeptide repeat-containing diguanylate cyclase [Candidatus Korobacter versatilis]|nr:diguanylate cyclase [Candidatus Koribacter versatilis]
MSDISKHLEKAEKYLQKGKHEDALEEYLQVLDEQPSNQGVRQTAAELCVSLGRTSDAATMFGQIFDSQCSIGDNARAVITYKKLVRVGKPSLQQMLQFAHIQERTNRKEALEAYVNLGSEYRTAGKLSDLLEVYRRISSLDPSIENYAQEGDLAAELDDPKTAAVSFVQAGILVEKSGGDASEWYEKAYHYDPTNPGAAFGHGHALLLRGEAEEAVTILEPLANYPSSPIEAREAYARALLLAGHLEKAEPVVWKLYEFDSRKLDDILELIGDYVDLQKTDNALRLTKKLEEQMSKTGRRREFVQIMQEMLEQKSPSIEFLYYMVELYNSNNREHDYCHTLLRLFELHYAAGEFLRAGDCLDRAAEVDPYEPGHTNRIEMLRGKLEDNRFNAIANRFGSVIKVEQQGGQSSNNNNISTHAASDNETTVLEDLILQSEIFMQYSMRSKAVERLERIHKLFPHEEERNEKLRSLYNNAGFFPQYSDHPSAQQMVVAPVTRGVDQQPAPPIPNAVAAENSVDNISRVTEITRNIYRQGNVKAVLFASVNDIGRHWNSSRCVAGLCSPGKPPSAALEYCAPGIPQSDVAAIVKLIGVLHPLAVAMGMVSISNARSAHELAPVHDVIETLGIESLLAVPLSEGDEQAGILILQQCTPRLWGQTDVVVLRTIADQMVLAVHNARLRSLVKNLAVTEEKSGLLKRSSYLDVLLSEVKRALQANAPVTLMLVEIGKAAGLIRDVGEAAVDSVLQQVGQVVQAHLRQNDVPVRYDLTQIAIVLSDTNDKNAFFVADKLRKVLGGTKIPGRDQALPISIGIAEAVMNPHYDPVDVVTEVINRLESALEAAKASGGNKSHSIAPAFLTAAAGD